MNKPHLHAPPCDRFIHLWPVWLDTTTSGIQQCRTLLPPAELLDGDRRTGQVARDFLTARAALRILIARYTGIQPQSIRYRIGSHGKPRLDHDTANLSFNVSHSGGLAVFAFARGCELGVDIEKIRPIEDLDNIARRFFCTREFESIRRTSGQERVDSFFRCWTRKEAFIKADGRGLSFPLNGFAVTIGSDEPVRLMHVDGDPEEASAWTMHSPPLAAGYASALAYRDQPRPIEALPPQTVKNLLFAVCPDSAGARNHTHE
ncbi:MAG: 4'-phosphopantetheinyl transferase superfamily protein [Acidimicrobiia bacterium]|nr:4'-phosphopantetheinyl transferase superfamily protein [Acidimicrobiia bacterium]